MAVLRVVKMHVTPIVLLDAMVVLAVVEIVAAVVLLVRVHAL